MFLRRAALGAPVLALVLLHCSSDPPGSTPADAGADVTTVPRRDAGPKPPEADSGVDAQVGDPNATEGGDARFEARYNELKFEDGTVTRTFLGFYDRTLGTMCNVGSAGAGKFYCLPVTYNGAEFPQFADASCTRPAVVHRTWWPYTVADLGNLRCDHQYYKKGTPTAARQAFYRDSSGACMHSPVFSDESVYPITPIATTQLGEFTRTDETHAFPEEKGGSRLVLRADRFRYADGAFVSRDADIYDLQTASTGEEALATDGVRRFIPAVYPTGSIFAADTCDTSAVALALYVRPWRDECSTSTERRAGWFRFKIGAKCGEREYHPRPTTAPLATWWYQTGDDRCVAASPQLQGSYEAYPAGSLTDEAPPATLAAVTHRWSSAAFGATSGTQLVAKSDVTESTDGLSLRARKWQLFLKGNDTPCKPTIYGPSGEPRCRPDESVIATFSELYSDSDCTQKTIGYLDAPTCAQPSRPKTYVRSPIAPYAVYRYPANFGTRTAVWTKETGACAPLPATTSPDFFDLTTLTLVPETEFPKIVSGTINP
ncbi:MAG: hypothetical protein HOO96_23970 [Polyangiaceae bacterium]|nr:hypothetical protein [Polyangiaceae bacterium]